MANQGITITVSAETAAAIQNLNKVFQTIEAGVSRTLEAAKPIAEIGVALLGLKGLESLADSVLKLGSELKNLQARTGGSIKDLVVLQEQLRAAGQSGEEAGMLLSFMQRAIVNAAEQGGASAAVFKDLHLSVTLSQLSAMNATEQYKLLGQAIASIENPAKRAEAIMKIFGRGAGGLGAVFADPAKFKAAFQGENIFGDAMARSADMFHGMEVSLEHLAYNGKKIMAGLLDEIGPMFQDAFKALGELDLTPIGQRIGALFTVIIDSWKNDKFPEMIGLLIEAGFEIGIAAAEETWRALLKTLEFLTSSQGGSIWMAMINGIMTFGVKAAEFLMKALLEPVTYMAAAFDWLRDQVEVGFDKLGAFLKSVFTDALNFFIDQWNHIAGRFHMGSIQPIAKTAGETEPGVSFAAALDRNSKMASELVSDATGFLDKQLEASRAILGINTQITTQDNTRLTALQRLNALIEEQMKKRAQATGEEAKSGGVPVESRLGPLRELERLQKEKILELDKQLFEVENDFTLTNVEKYEKKKQILEQQLKVYNDLVKTLQEKAKLEDAATAETTLQRADQVQKQALEKQKSVQGLGADPTSFSEQFAKTLTDLQNQWGTWAEQVANTFKTVFNSATSSISSGISGLIMGTKTWGQALYQISNTILTSIVNAIVEMGVKWVMTQVLMRGASMATAAIMRALNIEQQADNSTTLVSGAAAGVGTSGAEGGWVGVLIYMGVLAAALATIAGLSGAFAEGGRPPAGQMALVGERGPELFVPDRAGTIIPNNVTRQILSVAGAAHAAASGAAASAPGSRVVIVSDERKLRDMSNDPGFESMIVQINERNRWRYQA